MDFFASVSVPEGSTTTELAFGTDADGNVFGSVISSVFGAYYDSSALNMTVLGTSVPLTPPVINSTNRVFSLFQSGNDLTLKRIRTFPNNANLLTSILSNPSPTGEVYANFVSSPSAPPLVIDGTTLSNPAANGTNQYQYLVKFDSAGNLSWAQSFGCFNKSDMTQYYVTAQPDGSTAVVTGTFSCDSFYISNLTTPGPVPLGFPVGYKPSYVANWASDGTARWLTSIVPVNWTNAITEANLAVVDASGNVYVAGRMKRGLNWPGTAVGNLTTGANFYSPFIAKFSSSGAPLWCRLIGNIPTSSGTSPRLRSIRLDPTGNSLLIAGTYGVNNFPLDSYSLTLPAGLIEAGCLATISATDGSIINATSVYTQQAISTQRAFHDNLGNIYIAFGSGTSANRNWTYGTQNIEVWPLAQQYSLLVAKFSSTLQAQTARTMGTTVASSALIPVVSPFVDSRGVMHLALTVTMAGSTAFFDTDYNYTTIGSDSYFLRLNTSDLTFIS